MTSTPGQDQRMRAVIVQLNMVSHGSSAQWNAAGGQSSEHPGGKRPPGGGQSGQDWWNRYLAASDPETVIRQAEDDLQHARKSTGQRVNEPPEDLTARIRDLLDAGWTVKDVALACRCTPTRVRQAVTSQPATQRAAHAEVLRLHNADPGRTVRYLAARTGLPKSTVHDVLRRAA